MPSKHQPPSSRLIDMEATWILEMQAEHKSARTIQTYTWALRTFCIWLSRDGEYAHCSTTVVEASRAVLVRYFAWLYETKAETTTLVSHIGLSSFFKLCIAYDELQEGDSPMQYVKRPRPAAPETPILSDEHIRTLLASCERGRAFKDKRDYAILRVFLATGMRLAELQALQLLDVNLTAGTVHIQKGKGGRERTTAIGIQVRRALGQYLHARTRHHSAHLPGLWLSQRGGFHLSGIRVMVYRRAKEAGITGVHPHAFRHWFAHGFLSAGGNESDLLTLAGWRDSKMVRERYGASRAKERAIDAHHRLGIGEKF